MERGQPLAVGVERDLIDTRLERWAGQAHCRAISDERDLGRIAEQARRAALARLLDLVAVQSRRARRPPSDVDPPGAEASRGESKKRAVHRKSRRTVMRFCGQRSGLVGADHGRRAERLDRRQMADEDVRRPCAGSPSRGPASRSGAALGHVGDDDADREHAGVPERQPEGVARSRRRATPSSTREQPRSHRLRNADLALQRGQRRSRRSG